MHAAKQKPKVCFIGWDRQVCDDVTEHLTHFFSKYITAVWWSLHESTYPPEHLKNCRIYIASVKSAADYAKKELPDASKLITATRTLNFQQITKLLDLPEWADLLVISASYNGAMTTINLLKRLGINQNSIRPYYPGCGSAGALPGTIGIITGQTVEVPSEISQVVDLGSKWLDISTLVEMMEFVPEIPKALINEITQSYINEVFQAGIQQHKTANLNRMLKNEMNVILNTVDDAIISVDYSDRIVLFNQAAERLLGIQSADALFKNTADLFPELGINQWLKNSNRMSNKIRKVNGQTYVMSVNPILSKEAILHGGVISLRRTEEVLEMEETVRRKLFAKGHIAKYLFNDIIGASSSILRAKELAQKFAPSELAILLEGETGTGKELFAQSIHNLSSRRNNAFVAINFASLTDSLAESELFGYVEGAFTGARKGGQIGLFEQAHKGTIFLDEIGDASLEIQKKLLRVLENQEVHRIGADRITRVDVRVIAATNRDLLEMIKKGTFRSDLFYRLGTVPIHIPALCDRENDALHLLEYFSRQFFGQNIRFDSKLIEFVKRYSWPGNIRELQNIAKYISSLLLPSETATLKHLPEYLLSKTAFSENRYEDTSFEEEKNTSVVRELEHRRMVALARGILTELMGVNTFGKGLGRAALSIRLKEQGFETSEYQIKSALELLCKLGYCKAGSTRQGTSIMPDGKKFLQYIG